jgi:hypothetical protein
VIWATGETLHAVKSRKSAKSVVLCSLSEKGGCSREGYQTRVEDKFETCILLSPA